MNQERQRRVPGSTALLAFLLLSLVVAAIVISPNDHEWTAKLHEKTWTTCAAWMSNSVFEGESIGGSDIPVFVLAFALFACFRAWGRHPSPRYVGWRPQLGFVILSSFLVGVVFVHSLKYIMARARPYLVFDQGWPYTDWWILGPHDIAGGAYGGSFPSGHAAAAFLLMPVAYALFAGAHSRLRRAAGFALGAIAVTYATAMSVYRGMDGSHWISDGVLMILMGWILVHVLYYCVLRVPAQTAYFMETGTHPKVPPVWEMQLGLLTTLAAAGLTGTALGLRALVRRPLQWPAVLLPVGVVAATFATVRIRRVYRAAMRPYRDA
ncbi:MAG: phosphatase PAP2 family protein [Lentisphaerae bacterium]|nr:phosphatase PAP2 family protein [Lentisphaerota bacterium]